MRYEGQIYRPPSEADSYILQATIGCSWNKCVYCDMYREKQFRVRDLAETLEDLSTAARLAGPRIDKLFVADGDALVLDMEHWRSLLDGARAQLPRLTRVSCYATALNILNRVAPILIQDGLTVSVNHPRYQTFQEEARQRRLASD